MERVIDFPPAVWSALDAVAQAEGVPLGSVLREAIDRDLYRRQRARKAARPDERLIAPLRALLADDFAYARGWDDLQRRLRVKGYCLIESGPGLILSDALGQARICKASDLGHSHARLAGRFGRPFPGHAQGHVTARFRVAQTWD